MADWKKKHANDASKACEHELVQEVLTEFAGNMGFERKGLPEYGLMKIVNYTAQVARAQALGFDPDLLRMSERMNVVIICGDRNWLDRNAVIDTVGQLVEHYGERKLLVVTGGARGADRMAEDAARARGVHVAVVRALWDAHGKAAGPVRNGVMAALEPDRVVGFHANLDQSKGTLDMLRKARRVGLETWLHDGKRLAPWS